MLNDKYNSVKELKKTLEEKLDKLAFDAQLKLAHWWRTNISSEDFLEDTEGNTSIRPYIEANLLATINGVFDTGYKIDINDKDYDALIKTLKPLKGDYS